MTAPIPPDGAFAPLLTRAREEKGWTRYKLAKLAGISPTNLDKLERGADPKLSTLRALAKALGCRVRDLVDPG